MNIFALGLRWLYARLNALADQNNEAAMSAYEGESVVLSGANLEFTDKDY
jgi:hypothetical protein